MSYTKGDGGVRPQLVEAIVRNPPNQLQLAKEVVDVVHMASIVSFAAAVAQWLVRLPYTQKVLSSILSGGMYEVACVGFISAGYLVIPES